MRENDLEGCGDYAESAMRLLPTWIYLGCGGHSLPGWKGLDANPVHGIQWRWGEPIPFADGSADRVLIQHSLIYCSPEIWRSSFEDILRVLAPGGVLIVVEEDARKRVWRQPGSIVRGDEGGVIMSTSDPVTIWAILSDVGFRVLDDQASLVAKYGWLCNRHRLVKRGVVYVLEATKR